MTSTVTAAEISAMQDAQESLLPDTATVRTKMRTANGIGGFTETWANGATYACRLSNRGVPREYQQQAAVTGVQYWMVTLPHDATATRKDRLAIGSRTLEIVGFASGGEWETAKRAVCVEVD